MTNSDQAKTIPKKLTHQNKRNKTAYFLFNGGKIRLDIWLMGMIQRNHKTIKRKKGQHNVTIKISKYDHGTNHCRFGRFQYGR